MSPNNPRNLSGSWTVRAASLGGLLVFWFVVAKLVGDDILLPGPVQVGEAIRGELASGEILRHITATMMRVVAAFVIAMAIGLGLGLWMGRSGRANRWLDTPLIVFLNLPALVTIVLCYLWIGLTEAAAVTAVALNKIPMVTVMIREGARTLSPQLDDVVRVFRPGALVTFRDVILPQLAPQIASAARSGIALIWKIVLVVEFLGRSNGVGFQIHLGFQLFDVTQVLAYSLSFIAVMLLVEAMIFRPWELRANRWRRA